MKPQDELLISFHRQFAENQNHHQRLFIQFVAAVFIVLIGYAMVYINTGDDANLYTAKRNMNGEIIQYSVVHLLEAYFAAQIILCLMVGLVANTGYNFRRDQMVNFRIRQHYLQRRLYHSMFLEGFDPRKKRIFDYLPGFNLIFLVALATIQVLLFLSFMLARPLAVRGQGPVGIIGPDTLACLLPIVVSVLTYFGYWLKYQKKISNLEE